MIHIGEGVEAGDKDGHGDDESEEEAQCVHLKADADGPALYGLPAAQPVGDDLTVQHHGLHEGQYHAEGSSDGDRHHNIPCHSIAAAHQGGDKGADKKRHDRQNGEVYQKTVHYPFNLLISLVSRVPYCLLSIITRLRLMAVVQAPMTMEVRVSA